ncbi:NAD(P)/FAD-dependent oxidoreductase [Jeotgalibacillus proteolyticus]|uniref:Aminoacetone oxidase family FAD-binding enzyme n=1 Tax=Jeotgalibacillus proteolyticus TaxID=2082395 RepID=A0A2S5GFD6_9BACL|nr:NAD(P)/FAD-dependent oxidoreductase [Jeotgalibacillus proteolyticus]PPA71699.1 aminoacetone oxidase family FAD-binding enzyme [Jeotgalibacillus proteolyticus]
MNYDVIIIGGGPSGLMAAIAAGEKAENVLLVDKGSKLGKKLAISGGGRCNVTNRLPVEEIIRHIPGNGRFLYSAFSVFNNEDIIAFFEGLGVALKEEDHGRMFPVSNKAQSVVDALLRRLGELHVEIRTNVKVADLLVHEGAIQGIKLENGDEINSRAVVLAVGGKSVPQTGSTGDGYPWVEKCGHTVTELFPTEVPLLSDEPFIKDRSLQGLALRGAAVSVLNKKKKPLVTHEMDMLFTHFGLSGPAILRCSQYVVKEMKKQKGAPVTIRIDAVPSIKGEELFQQLLKEAKDEPKKAIKNVWKGQIPERYLHFLMSLAEIDPDGQAGTIASDKIRTVSQLIKSFELFVHGTQSIEKAFVTGGGVSVKEIEPKTMRSKKCQGLFICGELLDIHGYTGGYNITSALVTGRLAGTNAGLMK